MTKKKYDFSDDFIATQVVRVLLVADKPLNTHEILIRFKQPIRFPNRVLLKLLKEKKIQCLATKGSGLLFVAVRK